MHRDSKRPLHTDVDALRHARAYVNAQATSSEERRNDVSVFARNFASRYPDVGMHGHVSRHPRPCVTR
jgi:hypothetical protein